MKSTRKRDFTRHKRFPGTRYNSFDIFLRVLDVIEGLPTPVFGVLLVGLALPAALVHPTWEPAIGLYLFFMSDWALMSLLPRRHRSFGAAKPPTLMLASLRLPFALLPLPLALAAQVAGTALVIYGFWIEPQRVGLTRQALESPKVRAGRPLRLLHLGDLHAEIETTGRERQVLTLVESTKPDIIAFSGDFLSLSYTRDRRAWEVARAFLRELRAPLGVYAVTGSPAVDEAEVVPELLAGLDNVRWLRDEKITIEHEGQPIDIAGITCTHVPHVDGPRLLSVLGQERGPRERFTILLYHTPDLAPDAAEAGIDLMLSGHTHGGQVRLPWYGALFAGSLYGKRYEVGRIREGDMTLYVTRGIGLEGKGAPRVRFLSPPEVVLWEISGIEAKGPSK